MDLSDQDTSPFYVCSVYLVDEIAISTRRDRIKMNIVRAILPLSMIWGGLSWEWITIKLFISQNQTRFQSVLPLRPSKSYRVGWLGWPIRLDNPASKFPFTFWIWNFGLGLYSETWTQACCQFITDLIKWKLTDAHNGTVSQLSQSKLIPDVIFKRRKNINYILPSIFERGMRFDVYSPNWVININMLLWIERVESSF